MILCVGPNPAWDSTYQVDRLVPGASHRVRPLPRRAGGKAANVGRVLRQLQAPCRIVAPVGAESAEAYTADLTAAGVACSITAAGGPLRASITVVDPEDATVFNEPGPALTPAAWNSLLQTVAELLPAAAVVVLSGSLPPGAPADAYGQLTEQAHVAGAAVLVDVGGEALTAALPARPDVVKPNLAELESQAGRTLSGVDDVLSASTDLLRTGIGAVIVSRGRDGLVAATEDAAYLVSTPATQRGNPTGAGDTLAAGIADGLRRELPWPNLLTRAVALAAASVTLPQAGGTDLRLADRLADQIHTEELT